MPMVEAVLGDTGLGFGNLSRIAVCTGPGSFTGVRIGVSAARGLALGLGCPAVGVNRFEALAQGADAEAGATLAICLAAPRPQAYLQTFDGGAATAEPRLVLQSELAAQVDTDARWLGDGVPGAPAEAGVPNPAALLARAAAASSGAAPRPLYIRAPDAALPREAPPPLID